MKEEKNVKNIVIKYDDGTEREINKGAVVEYDTDGEKANLGFEFKDCSGKDLVNIVYGVMKMGANMGLFNDSECDEDD
ncbi:hypothetical protein AB2T90_13970 [Clostridium butyricum]|uniref:hypothetical protein n=1 Tax=Clostridium butyricum TaxID=1492 RepID=UPI003466FC35